MGLLDRVRRAFARSDVRPGSAALEHAVELYEQQKFDDAETECRRALERHPGLAQGLHLLGLIADRRGDHRGAERLIESAVAAEPEVGLYRFNLGNAQRMLGRTEAALASYLRAAQLEPDRFATWFNLGQVHAEQGQPDRAVAAFRRAIRIDPASGDARLGLAAALVDVALAADGESSASAEALALLESEWMHSSDPSRARFVLAMALSGCERWTEAASHLEALVSAHPDVAEARNQLANCYNRIGRAADAIREYRETYRIAPDFHHALTSVLGTLNAVADITPEAVFDAHCAWAETVAAPLYPAAARIRSPRDPGRRLRVGYVSPDLRRHPVGTMFAPVLERHDAVRVESFCYYNFPRSDVMTNRMRRAAHH